MIFKMKKFGGTIKRPTTTTTKKTIIKPVKKGEEDKYVREKFIADVAKRLSGLDVSVETITKILSNMGIDMTKELNDDDLFLIYNVLSEPLLERQDKDVIYGENDISEKDFSSKLLDVSKKFEGGLVNQRLTSMYENLPSLETNRTNFLIDKDIYRNRPLLGEGLYPCNRCGSKNTRDWQQQTRSADEPMTTFIHCMDCKAYTQL
jgi:hypothetical protein